MKKIKVNQDACIGCGACVAIDSEHFQFNDEGLSSVVNNENLESEELRNAIDSCPTSAISMTENEADAEANNCNEDSDCDCKDCECTEENNCGCHCNENEEN